MNTTKKHYFAMSLITGMTVICLLLLAFVLPYTPYNPSEKETHFFGDIYSDSQFVVEIEHVDELEISHWVRWYPWESTTDGTYSYYFRTEPGQQFVFKITSCSDTAYFFGDDDPNRQDIAKSIYVKSGIYELNTYSHP